MFCAGMLLFCECRTRVRDVCRFSVLHVYQNSGLLLSDTVMLGALEVSQGCYLR